MKTFEFETTVEKIGAGINLIRDGGGVVHGGDFVINGVEGHYSYNGVRIKIKITDKPWLASWDMIEEKLEDFFS